MSKPALEVARDFVRIAAEHFEAEFSTEVEAAMRELSLDLADLCNALRDCLVKRSNKIEADGAEFEVRGTTTEGHILDLRLWISSDRPLYRVLGLSAVEKGDEHGEKASA